MHNKISIETSFNSIQTDNTHSRHSYYIHYILEQLQQQHSRSHHRISRVTPPPRTIYILWKATHIQQPSRSRRRRGCRGVGVQMRESRVKSAGLDVDLRGSVLYTLGIMSKITKIQKRSIAASFRSASNLQKSERERERKLQGRYIPYSSPFYPPLVYIYIVVRSVLINGCVYLLGPLIVRGCIYIYIHASRQDLSPPFLQPASPTLASDDDDDDALGSWQWACVYIYIYIYAVLEGWFYRTSTSLVTSGYAWLLFVRPSGHRCCCCRCCVFFFLLFPSKTWKAMCYMYI